MRFIPAWRCALLTLSCLYSLAAGAVGLAPDAGQASRELQRQPELGAPKAITGLRSEPALIDQASAGGVRITVKGIHISGNDGAVPTAELDSLVAGLVGGDHSLGELDEGAARITAYYRDHDFVVARAYLPVQEISDGIVVIKVLRGLLGEQRLSNRSGLSDDRAGGYLRGIRSGDALQSRPVDRALALLSDTPGVGGARATLQPGASVGTTDLLIELDPDQTYTANLALDNYGNRYTGEYRLDAALGWNSPLHIGDQLIARALASDQAMGYARLAYQLPLGADGLKLGLAYADTRYSLGKEFATLQAHGTAGNSSVYATYPIVRTGTTRFSGALTWEAKRLVDETEAPASRTEKRLRLINLGFTGSHEDAVMGTGETVWDLSLVAGRLGMDALTLASDGASAQANGDFERFNYTLSRRQQLGAADAVTLTVSGQLASQNLGSSEKFSLGGANGVRAYPSGEASGDEGWMANLEWRHHWTEQLQTLLFHDRGAVRLNHRPFSAAANTRSIAGVGLGLTVQYRRVQFRTALAWSTRGGPPQSESTSAQRDPRLWAQLTGQF